MSVTITIPAERLAGWHRRWVERITPGLLAKAAAGALQVLVMRHLQKVARERHNTANRLGATPTGFWAGSAQAVRLHTHANDAEVSVIHPGIARAVRDVIIRPRRAKALTIPLRAEAYGRRPREFDRLSGAALFRPKGTRVLATEGGGRLTRESASVGGDRTASEESGRRGSRPTTLYFTPYHSLLHRQPLFTLAPTAPYSTANHSLLHRLPPCTSPPTTLYPTANRSLVHSRPLPTRGLIGARGDKKAPGFARGFFVGSRRLIGRWRTWFRRWRCCSWRRRPCGRRWRS